MARKNIFQLVEDSYDIQLEIRKINDQFSTGEHFSYGHSYWSLEEIMEDELFSKWPLRGTCLTVEEYLTRADAKISEKEDATEEQVINNLEVMENFIKLFNDNRQKYFDDGMTAVAEEFESVFCALIKILEKRMGFVARDYKDRIILYPQNASLEQVIDLCTDEDVQWELIRYVRENLSLVEKRKALAFLATNLYIEEDSNEKDETIKGLIKKACNVLNNLHIRHNNKTGKWENSVLEGLDDEDAISLCDMVYNEMLIIVLLREHKEYESTYLDFRKKQRAASAAKKEV